jgi:hypothetical protein
MAQMKESSNHEVAIVTGASSGIGEAAARLLARHGYRVVLMARRKERLEALAQELSVIGEQALAIPADLSKLEDIQHAVAECIERFGRIDVLVNNAGFGRLSWLEQLDPVTDIQALLQVNLLGLIWMTQAVLPQMIRQRRGHIINIASMAGYIATPTYSIYAASKFGVRGFTDALRREVGVFGIKVSGVYPGGVATEFNHHAGIQRKTGATTPEWLKLSAEDVAEAIYRLVRQPRRQVILPWPMYFAIGLNTLLPGVIDFAVQKLFVEPERLK